MRLAQIALLLFIMMFLLGAYVAHAPSLSDNATHSLETAISMVRWNCAFIVMFALSIPANTSEQPRYINLLGGSMSLVLLASLLFAGPIGLKYLMGVAALSFITPYSTLFFVLGYVGFIVALGNRIKTLNKNKNRKHNNDSFS